MLTQVYISEIHIGILGNVTCSAYPIAQLDSIDSKTGELNPVSALNLIVFGVSYTT